MAANVDAFIGTHQSLAYKPVERALAEAIKSRRKDLKLSQLQLAERSGLCRSYISDIERGARSVSLSNLVLLADALELPIWRLVHMAERTDRDSILVGL